ncbi:MAG TPA: class I SAM-dependent rRNA methyltransferase, partial [Kofleriaceae bacterium]|nr:class I SAM-dependent rRNA methyltransferase [Kofleriaceae bacterium]
MSKRRPMGAPIVRRSTVRLPTDVARRVRLGHPWVYREALGTRPLREDAGAVIELVDGDGEFVGRGLFEPEGAIAVRVITRDPARAVDAELCAARVRSAIELRRRFFDFDQQQSLRLINGEADGLPAIAVERYNEYLVAQLFSAAIEPLVPAIYDALEKELAPKAIYEQRRYKSLAGEAPQRAAAELVRGAAAPVELEVKEGDLTFWCDVTAPLSTGLFADLREGRNAVRHYAKGRRVLNLFSYTGAISVYAQAGGATEVVAVDVAAKAHARARKNFSASGFDPEKPEHIVGDAFKVMAKFEERKRLFDMVVIDPPAFASAAARGGKPWSALRDYSELVAACLRVLAPGGLLVAASSTHKIGASEFELAVAEGAYEAGVELHVIDRRGLPPDFPTAP